MPTLDWCGQNRAAFADIAVKYSEKTARRLTIAAESAAFGRADRDITAKTVADLGCFPL
jgi:hypothetical protein